MLRIRSAIKPQELTMFKVIRQFVITLFTGLNSLANALAVSAEVAEIAAVSMRDEAKKEAVARQALPAVLD